MASDPTARDRETARVIAGACAGGTKWPCTDAEQVKHRCVTCQRVHAIATALADERERAARVCESRPRSIIINVLFGTGYRTAQRDCAAAIRAGGGA